MACAIAGGALLMLLALLAPLAAAPFETAAKLLHRGRLHENHDGLGHLLLDYESALHVYFEHYIRPRFERGLDDVAPRAVEVAVYLGVFEEVAGGYSAAELVLRDKVVGLALFVEAGPRRARRARDGIFYAGEPFEREMKHRSLADSGGAGKNIKTSLHRLPLSFLKARRYRLGLYRRKYDVAAVHYQNRARFAPLRDVD